MDSYRDSSLSPPPDEQRRRRNGFVRRCERCCSVTLRHFPLGLVYGLTTWAIFTQVRICLAWQKSSNWQGSGLLILSLLLYGLLNWSYTVAVFTDPGSPLSPVSAPSFSRHNYSHLPSVEDPERQSITVKSTGQARFCKKCRTNKPDRAHHCSTCGRCVLKMDHHCPWLATCVGLRNYKAFLLFCCYVTLFCWVCFGSSAATVWGEISSTEQGYANAEFQAVNTVLLAVVAGIFGLVLAGFSGWHLSLAARNQTTIECLEKTRYLNPIRRTMDRATQVFPGPGRGGPGGRGREGGAEGMVSRYGHQLAEIHANAIPGVTRPEEGEERTSPVVRQGEYQRREQQEDSRSAAPSPPPPPTPQSGSQAPHPGRQVYTAPSSVPPLSSSSSSSIPPASSSAHASLSHSYASLERRRELDRYESYLDEQDGDKMPHAFDLGWRRNLHDLFGPDRRLWLLPICNSAGDGWSWAASPAWAAAQLERQARREARTRELREQGDPGLARGELGGDSGGGEAIYYDGPYDGPAAARGEGGAERYVEGSGDRGEVVFQGADVPLHPVRHRGNDDASSLDALYASDVEEDERVASPRQSADERGSRDEWRDWD